MTELIARLNAEADRWDNTYTHTGQRLAALLRAAAALSTVDRDAARYRYLRDVAELSVRDVFTAWCLQLNDGLDAAIDAAMAAIPPTPACAHEWREMRSSTDPYRDDECKFCGVAKAEAEK